MNCKERLTIKYENGFAPKDLCTIDRNGEAINCDGCYTTCNKHYSDFCKGCPIQKCFDKLGELEDKLENGTMNELPCKVGDRVYKICIRRNAEPYIRVETVLHITYLLGKSLALWQIHTEYAAYNAKDVFYTKEEAEARLKELQNG